MLNRETIIPLRKGGKIAIVAPAGAVDDAILIAAKAAIESKGYAVEIMPHVLGCATSVFSATDHQRADDLRQAIVRDDIAAIICARGGYGAVRTLQNIDPAVLRSCRKWIVGFSDITALHSLLSSFGVPSLHAPMLKHIAEHGMENDDIEQLFSIMAGKPAETTCTTYNLSRVGTAEGVLTGGNLSIIYSLRSTPADILVKGRILFIEDLEEYNYHIDRMMQNLKYSGVLEQINGLIVGQFSGMKDGKTRFGKDAYGIIADAVAEYDYPVLFGFPAGHSPERNAPLIMGQQVRLSVEPENARITWLK